MGISTSQGGIRRLTFGGKGERKTIHIGRVSREAAEEIWLHVAALLERKKFATQVPTATREWLSGVSPVIKKKLERAGLIESGQVLGELTGITLEEFKWEHLRTAGYAPNSVKNAERSIRRLEEFFGEYEDIGSITSEAADRFRKWVMSGKWKQNTERRIFKHIRRMFERAVRCGAIRDNPFRGGFDGNKPIGQVCEICGKDICRSDRWSRREDLRGIKFGQWFSCSPRCTDALSARLRLDFIKRTKEIKQWRKARASLEAAERVVKQRTRGRSVS